MLDAQALFTGHLALCEQAITYYKNCDCGFVVMRDKVKEICGR